jgi:metal-dependent hydrolase (beta-lactamase superfamily II)
LPGSAGYTPCHHFGATNVETKPGDLVADTFQGEHATVYNVKDCGLAGITPCGHGGVINSVYVTRRRYPAHRRCTQSSAVSI